MSATICPKCTAAVGPDEQACSSCGSISCRWVTLGLPASFVTDTARPTRELERVLRNAFAENLDRQGPAAFVCTNVGLTPDNCVLQVVSADAHAQKFTHRVEAPGLAFELEFPEGDLPSLEDLRAMPEAPLFVMKLDQLEPWEIPTANIDLRTDVDAAAHVVARLLVALHKVPSDGTVHVHTWAD